MTLRNYANRINELAAAEGEVGPDGRYCEDDVWLNPYVDGLTPEEAWEEEKAGWKMPG